MLPNWMTDPTGRVRPFDPGQIVEAIFAAGQRLGHGDAFLARELADGVVHFLLQEADDDPLTESAVRELTVKVVRELGRPALAREIELGPWPSHPDATPAEPADPVARAIADRLPPREIVAIAAAERFRQFALEHIYPPALAAAVNEGWLRLGGLATPLEMAGGLTVPPNQPDGWHEVIAADRERFGEFVVLDGPEYALTDRPTSYLQVWVRELRRAVAAFGLNLVVHLNRSTPPRWSGTGDPGPLFVGYGSAAQDELRPVRADDLLARLAEDPHRLRIDWHCGESDFRPDRRHRLARVVRTALRLPAVYFVFDRPKRPVVLADGIRDDRPALLTTIEPNCARLTGEPGRRKLPLLSRLAIDSGIARYDFLRRHGRPTATSHFQLERSLARIVPRGLDGRTDAVELVRLIRASIGEPARGPKWILGVEAAPDAAASFREQLLSAAAIGGPADDVTAVLSWPVDRRPDDTEFAHALWLAWRTPGVTRLRFRPPGVVQPILPGLDE